jgi:hypothetical protein
LLTPRLPARMPDSLRTRSLGSWSWQLGDGAIASPHESARGALTHFLLRRSGRLPIGSVLDFLASARAATASRAESHDSSDQDQSPEGPEDASGKGSGGAFCNRRWVHDMLLAAGPEGLSHGAGSQLAVRVSGNRRCEVSQPVGVAGVVAVPERPVAALADGGRLRSHRLATPAGTGGPARNRTAVDGFAIRCLTTWLRDRGAGNLAIGRRGASANSAPARAGVGCGAGRRPAVCCPAFPSSSPPMVP